MKFNAKKVFVVSLAISLVAIISFGTLAWFNAEDSITNTFKVANSDDPTKTPEFSVEVSETDPSTNAPTTDGVTYYTVLPGDKIAKDPTVTNTGDYDQWIRVAVVLNKASGWKNAGGSLTFTELFEGSTYGLAENVGNTAEKWLLVKNTVDVVDDTATWYLYLNRKLPKGGDEKVFTNVNIPTVFTQQDMAYINNEFAITVKADAIQADNTGDNAVAGFATANWEAGKAYSK